ncbi:MAG: hypothetical protein EPN85_12535 [Bacteroidetes bacterium]|nr:MAG: hypothetical protein EPN85_12535 [Bacteroidota bacterium]
MIDKEKYLKEHLPYSIRILLAHEKLTRKIYEGDKDILEAIFVGSLIKGRMLLEVIGITIKRDGSSLRDMEWKEGDGNINATHLDGKIIKCSDVNEKEKMELLHFLIATNKYEAHLTDQSIERDLAKIKPAVRIILRLIEENIYAPNNIPFPF